MTRRRDPFFMALDSLRSRAEQGVYAPGAPVVIVDEAQRLGISTTPVREALVWLCGYGLLERAPTGGFLAPRLDPATVRDRYALRQHCVALSLGGPAQIQADANALTGGETPRRSLEDHMTRAVRSTGNAALVDAFVRVCRQLVQLAPAERRLFNDFDEESERIAGLFARTRDDGLSAGVQAYHQRRMDAAALLVLEAEVEWCEPGRID